MTRRHRIAVLVAGLAALVGAGLWGLGAPRAFFPAWLAGFVFWSSLPLGALQLLMLHLLTGGRWGRSLRPQIGRALRGVVLLPLFFVPVALGLADIFPWARPEVVASEPVLQKKTLYLNEPFFLVRAAVFLAVWILLAWATARATRDVADTSGATPPAAARRWAAGGMVLYILTASFAAVDWIASLVPVWYSTIIGLYLVVGQALTWLAVAVLVLSVVDAPRVRELLAQERVRVDLGNLLLTLVILHAYMGFSQWLVIWNGNKPHEIAWYLPRLRHGWQWATVALGLTHFWLPFAALLFRAVKRDLRTLRWVAGLILAARLLDAVWMVLPGVAEGALATAGIGVLVIGGLGGVWLAVVAGRPAASTRRAS